MIDCLCFPKMLYCFIVHCTCSALSCKLSPMFCPQLSLWFFACCCVKMLSNRIPALQPRTLPAACAGLVNPCMARNIPAYFWRCHVFWDLTEIAYHFCYHTQGQRMSCISGRCQPYNFYNISSENLVLDQLIIPQLIFFFILITYLVDIVFVL